MGETDSASDDESFWDFQLELDAEDLDAQHDAANLANCLVENSYSWMPPLRGFNLGDSVFRWFRLKLGYKRVEPCMVKASIPNDPGYPEPSWVKEEDSSLSSILDDQLGHDDHAWVSWGLENGVSPGQPFLIGFLKPVWSRTSYEYDEWDADYPWALIRVLPNNPVSAIRSWDRAIKQMAAIKVKKQRHSEHTHRLSLALKHRWKIDVQHFGGSHFNSPDRVQLSLICASREAGNSHLAWGEAGGDHYVSGVGYVQERSDKDVAFSRLLANFMKSHPEEDPAPLIELAGTAGIALTRIDRILYASTG